MSRHIRLETRLPTGHWADDCTASIQAMTNVEQALEIEVNEDERAVLELLPGQGVLLSHFPIGYTKSRPATRREPLKSRRSRHLFR